MDGACESSAGVGTGSGLSVSVPFTNGGCTTMIYSVAALQELCEVMEKVFSNVERSAGSSRQRLTDLCRRVDRCATAVDRLNGKRQALLVQNRQCFPSRINRKQLAAHASSNLPDEQPLLRRPPVPAILPDDTGSSSESEDAGGFVRNPFVSGRWLDASITGQDEERYFKMLEEQNWYSKPLHRLDVKCEELPLGQPTPPSMTALLPLQERAPLSTSAERDLGCFLQDLRSASSLMLFNTQEILYRDSHGTDALAERRQERDVDADRSPQLGNGAEVHIDFMTMLAGEEYAFVPRGEAVTSLTDDLPIDLPLEDIADVAWESYVVGDTDVVAPSWRHATPGRPSTEHPASGHKVMGISSSSKVPLALSTKVPPAPPPPPPAPSILRMTNPSGAPPPPPGMTGKRAPPSPPPPPPGKNMKLPPALADVPPPVLPSTLRRGHTGVSTSSAAPGPTRALQPSPTEGKIPPPPPPPPSSVRTNATRQTPPTSSHAGATVGKTATPTTSSHLAALSQVLDKRRRGIIGMHSDEEASDSAVNSQVNKSDQVKSTSEVHHGSSSRSPPPPLPPPHLTRNPPRPAVHMPLASRGSAHDSDDDDW